MNRLNKELMRRGITWKPAPEYTWNSGADDNEAWLIDITDKFILIGWSSQVMPTELRIYDRNFNLIGGQDLEKDLSFNGSMSFNSWGFVVNNIKDNIDLDFE